MEDLQLTLVDSTEEVNNFLRWLGERRPVMGCDTETGGLDWWREPLRVAQFGDARHGWAIPVEWWKRLVHETLQRYDGTVVFHNQKFDLHFLETNGLPVKRERVRDTVTLAHLVEPHRPKDLKGLARRYDLVPRAMLAQSELKVGMAKHGWTWRTVPLEYEPYWVYAALDPVLTARLFERLEPLAAPYRSVEELELGTSLVLLDMERRGVRVDVDYLRDRDRVWGSEIADRWAHITETYGVGNPLSHPEVAAALLDRGFEITARTEKGQVAVTEEVLANIPDPLAADVLALRKVHKFHGTYVEQFLRYVDETPEGWMLHTSVNALGARTARMSTGRPSLQNLPRKAAVRRSFVPRDGRALLLSDYDQIELRLIAHYSADPTMVAAFRAGLDLHDYTTNAVYGLPLDGKPPKHLRHLAKRAGFAKIYGAGLEKFAWSAGVDVEVARAFLTAYDATYPEVPAFMGRVIAASRQRRATDGEGWVKTHTGRRHVVDAGKDYVAVNYLIQGAAADVLKRKILELDAAGVGEYLVLPVHDELVFDVPLTELSEVRRVVEEVMPVRGDFAVDLTVSSKVCGSNWGEAYEDET